MELVIQSIYEEAKGVKTFALSPANGNMLLYRPGQFLTFPIRKAGKELRRSYSLSSAPGVDALPAITVKRVENGLFSRPLIDDMKLGDRLETVDDQATGLFTLPKDGLAAYAAVWLFAAGIGITPVYALLKALLHHTAMPRIVLVYSNHSRETTVFLREIEAFQKQHWSRLQVTHLWSNTQDLQRARLSGASFPLLRKELLTDTPERTLCYLCGPASYMWMLQLLLQDAGVPPANMRREAFVVKEIAQQHLPADKGAHRVTVLEGASSHTFINTYPQSILDSAKAAGLRLPYSCNTGQCGSCTALCTEGNVWMSYNEVLTGRDIAAGRVLTCTGHAVNGDVVLSYR